MSLGVAADPDLSERVASGLKFFEQAKGIVERSLGDIAIAGNDECAADAGGAEPVDGIGQVPQVAEQPGGQMRSDRVPVRRQALRQLDGRLHSLAGGHGDAQRHRQREPRHDRFLGRSQREHLVGAVAKGPLHRGTTQVRNRQDIAGTVRRDDDAGLLCHEWCSSLGGAVDAD